MAKQRVEMTTKEGSASVLEGVDADEIDATMIGGGFVPRARKDTASIEIDGETVVMVDRTLNLVWLDARGTILLKCFDGIATIDDIVADLSEVFGVDLGTVKLDTLQVVQDLGRIGYLEGVKAAVQPSIPGALWVGQPIPPFELADLDGRLVKSQDLVGQRTLLINWATDCRYCRQIAPELAELQPDLEREGVALILMSSGSPKENRKLAQEVGLHCSILLQDEDTPANVFAGQGTPVGYLVDEEGKAASDLVRGSGGLPMLARALAGREVDQETSGGREVEADQNGR